MTVSFLLIKIKYYLLLYLAVFTFDLIECSCFKTVFNDVEIDAFILLISGLVFTNHSLDYSLT